MLTNYKKYFDDIFGTFLKIMVGLEKILMKFSNKSRENFKKILKKIRKNFAKCLKNLPGFLWGFANF